MTSTWITSGSRLTSPREHLKKKIFLYTLDLLRGRIKLAEFVRTSSAAIKTSLRTNMRSVYQSWVFLSLLEHLAKNGARLIYPEYGYLSLERTGKQKLGAIPPNSVLSIEGVGYVSFFIEAPRPVGWEDSKDLKRVWKLYVALRPDMLVYAGKVLDIVRPFRDPPIERPNLIIECKELVDWYQRVRDLKGTLAKPLSAEEWRSRWIQGLYDGLADVLGVKRQEAINLVKERKTVRVKEDRLVALYRSLYKPDVMVLVSRAKVPCDVRRNLEEHGIEVLDDVGFNKDSLKPLADVVIDVVSKQPRKELDVYVEAKLLLEEVLKRGESLEVEDLDRVLALAVRFARAKLDDFVGFLARRDGRE